MRKLDTADAAVEITRNQAGLGRPRAEDRAHASGARGARKVFHALEVSGTMLAIDKSHVEAQSARVLHQCGRWEVGVEHEHGAACP